MKHKLIYRDDIRNSTRDYEFHWNWQKGFNSPKDATLPKLNLEDLKSFPRGLKGFPYGLSPRDESFLIGYLCRWDYGYVEGKCSEEVALREAEHLGYYVARFDTKGKVFPNPYPPGSDVGLRFEDGVNLREREIWREEMMDEDSISEKERQNAEDRGRYSGLDADNPYPEGCSMHDRFKKGQRDGAVANYHEKKKELEALGHELGLPPTSDTESRVVPINSETSIKTQDSEAA